MAGRVAQDLGSAGGGDIPAPPPIPAASSSEGGSLSNPENPSMVAHQTAPNAFAVVDNEKGTISRHRGNLSTPHTAQAAFNAHAATAQPLDSDSDFITPDNLNT
jgi:hypothetical protein